MHFAWQHCGVFIAWRGGVNASPNTCTVRKRSIEAADSPVLPPPPPPTGSCFSGAPSGDKPVLHVPRLSTEPRLRGHEEDSQLTSSSSSSCAASPGHKQGQVAAQE